MILGMILVSSVIEANSVGEILRVPGWMSNETINEDHTYGSARHSNQAVVKRRIGKADISAVYAAPEAFYERAWFSSAGASNSWDALYGPFTIGPDCFTAGVSFVDSQFYESPMTNGVFLGVPDTMRFYDFDNIVRAYKRGAVSLIDRCCPSVWRPSWDSDYRTIWFSTRRMISEIPLESCAVDWVSINSEDPHEKEKIKILRRIGNSMFPLSATGTIGVGCPLHTEKEDQNAVSRSFVEWCTFGPDRYGVYQDRDKLTFSATNIGTIVENVAAATVANRSNDAKYPSFDLSDYTRRLAPDEYTSRLISFDETKYRTVSVEIGNVSLPDKGFLTWVDHQSLVYGWNIGAHPFDVSQKTVYKPFAEYSDYFRAKIYYEIVGQVECRISVSNLTDNETVRVDVVPHSPKLDLYYYLPYSSVTDCRFSGIGMDAELYKLVPHTNETTLVTALAAANRAAAALERTYEVMNLYRENVEYNYTQTDVTGSGGKFVGDYTPVTVSSRLGCTDSGEWIVIHTAESYADIQRMNAVDRQMDYATTSSVGRVAADRDRLRFSGVHMSLDSRFEFSAVECMASQDVSVAEYDLSFVQLQEGEQTLATVIEGRSEFPFTVTPVVYVDGTYIRPVYSYIDCDSVVEAIDHIDVRAAAVASGSYNSSVTEPFTLPMARSYYYYAGPCQDAYTTGRAGRDNTILFAMSGVCHQKEVHGGAETDPWSWVVSMNADLYEISNEPRYVQERFYKARAIGDSSKVSSPFSWTSLVQARTDSRNKVMEFVQGGSPSDLMPMSPDLIENIPVAVDSGSEFKRGITVDIRVYPGGFNAVGETAPQFCVKNTGGGNRLYYAIQNSLVEVDHFTTIFRVPVAINHESDLKPSPQPRVNYVNSRGDILLRGPFAVDGKASGVIRTDWKWHTLSNHD